jgi:hypothetical protein
MFLGVRDDEKSLDYVKVIQILVILRGVTNYVALLKP